MIFSIVLNIYLVNVFMTATSSWYLTFWHCGGTVTICFKCLNLDWIPCKPLFIRDHICRDTLHLKSLYSDDPFSRHFPDISILMSLSKWVFIHDYTKCSSLDEIMNFVVASLVIFYKSKSELALSELKVLTSRGHITLVFYVWPWTTVHYSSLSWSHAPFII